MPGAIAIRPTHSSFPRRSSRHRQPVGEVARQLDDLRARRPQLEGSVPPLRPDRCGALRPPACRRAPPDAVGARRRPEPQAHSQHEVARARQRGHRVGGASARPATSATPGASPRLTIALQSVSSRRAPAEPPSERTSKSNAASVSRPEMHSVGEDVAVARRARRSRRGVSAVARCGAAGPDPGLVAMSKAVLVSESATRHRPQTGRAHRPGFVAAGARGSGSTRCPATPPTRPWSSRTDRPRAAEAAFDGRGHA